MPKGHIAGGETEMQCALRELEEETGIAAADIALDTRFRFEHMYRVSAYRRYNNEPVEKTLVVFLGRLLRDVCIECSEHGDHRWIDWAPPQQIQAFTIDPLLAAVERHFEEHGGFSTSLRLS